MPIAISCGHCDWKGKVKDEMAGKTGKCPTCGEHIPIPRGSSKAPAPPPMPAKKPQPPVEDDDEPVRKPKSKLSRDEDDDRPRKRRPVDDEEDEPRPRKKISRLDDDDDEPRPKKKKPARFHEDDDEPRPKKKRKKKKPPESMNGKKVSAIGFGLLAVLVGGGWLAWMFLGDGRFRFYPLILLLIGLIGMFQGFTGIGLSEDDDD